jgi:preprotein translocase subunit SecB
MSEAPKQNFAIQRIFLKDVSFETPIGADVFKQKWQPKVQLDMNTRTEKISDTLFEVVLTLTVTANIEDEKIGFLCEIQQAGIFTCEGFSGDQLRQIHSVNCPEILFPYAREAIDALAIKGSFPPLMLAPINFDALFKQALAKKAEGEQAAVADKTH